MYLATYTVEAPALSARGHRVEGDVPRGRILRSVLMKPETESYVPALHALLLDVVAEAQA
jgi:hypothetical protein